MWTNPPFFSDLVTFTKEILNGKLLRSVLIKPNLCQYSLTSENIRKPIKKTNKETIKESDLFTGYKNVTLKTNLSLTNVDL